MSYTTQLMSKFDRSVKEPYVSILSKIENKKANSDLYMIFVPFIYYMRDCSGKNRFNSDNVVVTQSMSFDSFADRLLQLEFQSESDIWGKKFNLKSKGFFDENYEMVESVDHGYYKSKSSNEIKVEILEKFHKHFIDQWKIVKDFVLRKKDPYYTFRQSNTEHFEDIYAMFVKNVLPKLFKKEDFVENMSPVFDEKVAKSLSVRFPKVDFEYESKVYLVKSEINFDEVMKNGLPSVETFKMLKVLAEENKYNKNNPEVNYYFSNDFAYEKNREFEEIKDRLLIIKQTAHGLSANYAKKDYLLFLSKKEASDYHKNKLKEVKKRINNILKEDAVATF